MTNNFAPGSLRPLYVDYLSLARENKCGNCGRILKAAAATMFAHQGRLFPMGPACAKKCAVPGTMKGLPNLTSWTLADIGTLDESSCGRKPVTMSHDTITHQGVLPNTVAMEYALLRVERLPQIDLFRPKLSELRYTPLVLCVNNYKKNGQVEAPLLKAVQTTMRATETNMSRRHLSYDNIKACFYFGWLLTEIKSVYLPQDVFKTWLSLAATLGRTMYLNPDQCLQAEKMAGKIYPDLPKRSKRLHFVDPNTPPKAA